MNEKPLLPMALCFLFACACAAAAAQPQSSRTAAFRVEGMKGESAVQRVEAALKRTPGILETAADPKSEILMVKFDPSRATISDIAEAVDAAGFSLGPVDAAPGGRPSPKDEKQRARVVLTDFQQVLNQTKEALVAERMGLARSLALAMRVRRDAIVEFEKKSAPVVKGKAKPPAPPTMDLAMELSRAVDDLGAAAEARDREGAEQRLPKVRQAFRKLAEARHFDDLIAPPPPPKAPGDKDRDDGRSLQDQLQDLLKGFGK